MSEHTDAIIARARAKTMATYERIDARATYQSAPWTGCHNGRKAEASTSADVYTGESALYMVGGAPDGALDVDRVARGWAGAWARRNTTRAGKSERRSIVAGSDHGARRGDAEGWPAYKPINGVFS
jgi:hypothetical protein